MKQSSIKALCEQYIAGTVSDAHLLSQLQVGDDVKALLLGVTALPMAAQLRIRIEDLYVSGVPKPKTLEEDAQPSSEYMTRLRKFAQSHFEDEGEVIPAWTDPHVTCRNVSRAVIGGPTVFYTFVFMGGDSAWPRALVEEIKESTTAVFDAPDPSLDIQFGVDTIVLTIDEPTLRWIGLVPSSTEVRK